MVECYEICVRLVNEFTVCFQALFGRTFYSQEGALIQPRSSRKNAISAVGAKVAINCISMAQALGNRHEARTLQQYRTRRLHFASIGYFFNIHISIFSTFISRVWFRQILICILCMFWWRGWDARRLNEGSETRSHWNGTCISNHHELWTNS